MMLPVVATRYGGALLAAIVDQEVVAEIVAKLLLHAAKVAVAAREGGEEAAAAMVVAMREDAPELTGRLRAGIEWFRDGDMIEVRASAIREGAGGAQSADYARFVELGTRGGARGTRIARQQPRAFYATVEGTDLQTFVAFPGRTRAVRRSHPGTEAQPFFWPNARRFLGEYRLGVAQAALEYQQ